MRRRHRVAQMLAAMRHLAPVPGAVILLACPKPMTDPEPTALHTARTVRAALSAAATALTAEGFEISVSDAATGIMTAKRVRGPQANAEFIACNWATGSIFDTHAQSTLTLSITAKPAAGSGSDVQIALHVHVEFPSLTGPLATGPSDSDCVSNGTAERAVAAAITG